MAQNLSWAGLLILSALGTFCVEGTKANAATVDFVIDSSLSNVTVTFTSNAVVQGLGTLGPDVKVDNSALSGTGTLNLGSLSNPFGTARIEALSMLLMEGLTFVPELSPFVPLNVASNPNGVSIGLTTAGDGGLVTAGLFDQSNNVLENAGTFIVSGAVDDSLDFVVDNNQDFLNTAITRVGDELFLTGTFDFTWAFEEVSGGNTFSGDIRWAGTFVGVTAVPEPSSAMLLASLVAIPCVRRFRNSRRQSIAKGIAGV